jgi:hypothetical protein
MTLAELQLYLGRLGVRLSVRPASSIGDGSSPKLVVDAPAGALTDDLRAALVACKPALVAALVGSHQSGSSVPRPRPLADAQAAIAIDHAFRYQSAFDPAFWGAPPAGRRGREPTAEEVVDLVESCARPGIRLRVEAGVNLSAYVPRGCRLPEGWLRRLAAWRGTVCGYLSRIRSPFFDGDRELAAACAIEDDRRLREMGGPMPDKGGRRRGHFWPHYGEVAPSFDERHEGDATGREEGA